MKGRKPDQNAIRRGVSDAYIVPSGDVRGLVMPADIAADPVQSVIWSWVAPPVNNFTEQDMPNLRLLVYWHAVAAQAQEAMKDPNGSGALAIMERVGYIDDPDGKQRPIRRKATAIQVLKEASAEIRALSDMLGLSPLARSRIGLLQATTVKTAADTAAIFQSIDAAYGNLPEASA